MIARYKSKFNASTRRHCEPTSWELWRLELKSALQCYDQCDTCSEFGKIRPCCEAMSSQFEEL